MTFQRKPIPPVTGDWMTLRQCADVMGIGPRDLRMLVKLDCCPPYRRRGHRLDFETAAVMRSWQKPRRADDQPAL